MKFKTDKCPICQSDLRNIQLSSEHDRVFTCPVGESRRDREKYDGTKMPKSHRYDVTIHELQSFQNIEIPPFAIDSSCTNDIYTTTLYKWSNSRPSFNDEPGWVEIGEYPFIEINGHKEGIEKIKRLLLFI